MVREAFGVFAATVGEHAGIDWPGQTTARPYAVTGRSTAPKLDQPSMVWLRLRAMFGLTARTEILRYFLSQEAGRVGVATIAAATNYTKRNVAEECETLQQAGVLGVRPVGNRFYYSLVRRAELKAVVGAMPAVRPDWTAIFNVARSLISVEDQLDTSTTRTLAVKAGQVLVDLEPELDALDVDPPSSDLRGEDLWHTLRALGRDTMGVWSLGRWHRLARDKANERSIAHRIS